MTGFGGCEADATGARPSEGGSWSDSEGHTPSWPSCPGRQIQQWPACHSAGCLCTCPFANLSTDRQSYLLRSAL